MKNTVCFDLTNLAIRNLFGPDVIQMNSTKTEVISVDYELYRYRVFDSIYKSLFRINNVSEVILAMDDKKSWRKIYWPKYKAHRKEKREKVDINWDEYYAVYDEFTKELRDHMPFKVIDVKDAEADDVIGVLALDQTDKNYYIISTDKDFLQLCSKRVKIYNPLKKEYVEHPNTELFIVEQCLCGQTKDNIWNVKTPLDYPDGKRKPGFGETQYEKVIAYGWQRWLRDNKLEERFEFNRNLMDFERIPQEIKRRILRDYNGYVKSNPENIYEFFKKHPWPEYMDNFTNVENRLLELY